MTDENKAPEAPVEEVKPEAPADGSLIENRRAEIEKLVQSENETVPENPDAPEPAKAEEPEEKPEPEKPEDPLERIKKSVQKRIDKVVAQKKTLEEELAETKAELDRLKARVPEPQSDDSPPTVEQVEAYIVKMREEGNVKEEVAAMRYLVKLEKEQALKEVRETQTKAQKEESAKKERELASWADLQRDYVAYDSVGNPDLKSDLTLSNQNGLLYKTALSLYNDKDLHADFYNDPNVINGFRRAVADAYREIHQQGLIKQTPKGQLTETRRVPRPVLADPDAEVVEDTAPQSVPLSDAEKVREEIRARKNNRYIRKLSQ